MLIWFVDPDEKRLPTPDPVRFNLVDHVDLLLFHQYAAAVGWVKIGRKLHRARTSCVQSAGNKLILDWDRRAEVICDAHSATA
jgi:hypothetical protein